MRHRRRLVLWIAGLLVCNMKGQVRDDSRTPVPRALRTTAPSSEMIRETANGVSVVPGAILCENYERTNMLFDLYTRAWEEQKQDSLTRGQSTLLRGPATQYPVPERFGCVLIAVGTELYAEKGNVVPAVRAKVRGQWIRGVTLPAMVSAKTSGQIQNSYEYASSHTVDKVRLGAVEGREAASGSYTVSIGETDPAQNDETLASYVGHIALQIKRSWLSLLPEEKTPRMVQGAETVIRVTLQPDGNIEGMKLISSSQDQFVDRACWAAVTSSGGFGPLPATKNSSALTLNIDFRIDQEQH